MTQQVVGKTKDGQDIILYTLENANHMKATILNYGAILVDLLVPDKTGALADVVLGYDDPTGYFDNGCFFGAVIGPNANRIGGATFELNGQTYALDVNDGPNNLHSHKDLGYHKRIWDVTPVDGGICLSLEDADGSMGFPGKKSVSITYTLDDENALKLAYHASSDKPTILNLTNHTYFNLDGHKGASIEGHSICLKASRYTPVVAGAIPTGELASVKGTVMDFTEAKKIGLHINDPIEQLTMVQGYDHNWSIDDYDGTLRLAAVLTAPVSGRKMEVYTDLPGIQFYAGNCITPQPGKDGANYVPRSGLCLETQYYPDTIHQPAFPSCVFGAGKDYDSVTVYKFS
jgi:aldose 1-epimerase